MTQINKPQTKMAIPLMIVFFNGMGSTRAQGLRYVNTIHTTKNGKPFYRAEEPGKKYFQAVWLADDFDDIVVEDVGTGVVLGEPRRASVWRWLIGVADPAGFVFRLVLHRWFPPCSETQIQKGLKDVRDALAVHDKVGIYGMSRGAALAIIVLSRLTPEEQSRIHAVVAEAPFDSLANVIADRYRLSNFWRWLLGCILPAGPLGVELPPTVPLLIGAGTKDESCPFEGQARLAKKFTHAKLHVVDGADHNTIWQNPNYKREVLKIMTVKK